MVVLFCGASSRAERRLVESGGFRSCTDKWTPAKFAAEAAEYPRARLSAAKGRCDENMFHAASELDDFGLFRDFAEFETVGKRFRMKDPLPPSVKTTLSRKPAALRDVSCGEVLDSAELSPEAVLVAVKTRLGETL